MGGSALSQKAPRLSRKEYNRVVAELKPYLAPEFYLLVEEPRSFATKTSFGDVDLLATSCQKDYNAVEIFGSSESKRNHNIKHFDYQGYQVDVIEIAEDHMDLARWFYGYGDTGMITGMFVRNLGLKFGLDGLTYKCETYKVKLSHDLRDILHFLGLSHDVWKQGFDNQEAFFRYMACSKYFRPYFFSRKNPEVLELDADRRRKGTAVFETPTIWNHEARCRLAERPMFHSWIEFVETLPDATDKVDPEQVRAESLRAFGKEAVVQGFEDELSLTRRVKVKFNGKLAMEWTNQQVKGKDLGNLTAAFKAVFPLARLDLMSQDQIQEAFVSLEKGRRTAAVEGLAT